VPCVRSWHPRGGSFQVMRVLQASVLLLIRWFRSSPHSRMSRATCLRAAPPVSRAASLSLAASMAVTMLHTDKYLSLGLPSLATHSRITRAGTRLPLSKLSTGRLHGPNDDSAGTDVTMLADQPGSRGT
jgi:hypothetical protein